MVPVVEELNVLVAGDPRHHHRQQCVQRDVERLTAILPTAAVASARAVAKGRAVRHKRGLGFSLDGTGTGGPDAPDRVGWGYTEFGKQHRRQHARTPEPARTMNQHPLTSPKKSENALPRARPGTDEVRAGRTHVGDRQVMPFEAGCLQRASELRHAKAEELVRLEQGQNRRRMPGRDGRNVSGEIAPPMATHVVHVIAPRAVRQAERAAARRGNHGNAERPARRLLRRAGHADPCGQFFGSDFPS